MLGGEFDGIPRGFVSKMHLLAVREPLKTHVI